MFASAFMTGGMKVLYDQNIDTSQTWVKATALSGITLKGTEIAEVTLWSAGGGGGFSSTSASAIAGGGGAGTFLQFVVPLWMIGASVALVIGAAGAGGLGASSTASTAGGQTSFGISGFKAPGGSRGNDQASGGSAAVSASTSHSDQNTLNSPNVIFSSGVPGAAANAVGNDASHSHATIPYRYSPGGGAGGSSTASVFAGGAAPDVGGGGKGGDGASSTTAATAGVLPGGGGGGGRGLAAPYYNGGNGGGGRIRIRILQG